MNGYDYLFLRSSSGAVPLSKLRDPSAHAAPPGAKEENMNPRRRTNRDDELLPEYDFTGAVRGKYYERYRQGTNIVLLDPDVAAVFRDSAAVNDTLRRLVSLAEAQVTGHKSRTPRHARPNKPRQPTSRTRRGGARKRARTARG